MSGAPWLAITGIVLATSASAATHSLPLRRGVYAEVSTDCHGAPSSARSRFGGGYVIQHPHAQCLVRSAARAGPSRFVVTERCFEYGDRTKPFDVVNRIRVLSRTEYQLDNEFGRFHARWCRG